MPQIDRIMKMTLNMTAGITLRYANQTIDLHPSGALFWLDASTLIIADLHLIPQSTHWKLSQKEQLEQFAAAQLKQLERSIEQYLPERVLILGDITGIEHKPIQTVFQNWIEKRTEDFGLVKELDVQSHAFYQKLHLNHYAHFIKGPFYISHNPSVQLEMHTLCGQVQPGVWVDGVKESKNLLPSFHVSEHQIILPSFGGNYAKIAMDPQEGVALYPIGAQQIHRFSMLNFQA